MLQDADINVLRPSSKHQKFTDEKGLSLLVTPSGSRLWRFRYRFPPRAPNSKEKMISLGSYPEIPLEQARERRDAARRDVANGIDPSLRRTCEKICLERTFETVARGFLGVLRATSINVESSSPVAARLINQALKPPHHRRSRMREPISANTVETMERRLEMHVFPYIGEKDVQFLRKRSTEFPVVSSVLALMRGPSRVVTRQRSNEVRGIDCIFLHGLVGWCISFIRAQIKVARCVLI